MLDRETKASERPGDHKDELRLWLRMLTCSTLIEGQLQSRYYYLYAEDAARGGRWTGNVNMCVADNEFKITGVQDCYARGYQQFGFKEYDTGRQGSWMVQLTDTPTTNASQN